ncbi:glycosyltransferase family 2 protein [Paenibacillus pasadenensis]|uniref:glycosyltransferase family 2 protein n=1 Tax=Paenibacillus pasadenensis TaxID=217090 RepID=UPI00203EF7D8|nr:glycosyltransferase family 2 protein [Paenibacillus pasadenensis]MCM3746884.1 glycosyltransferase family 2 protein [Paenibacillus pasadenensis]
MRTAKENKPVRSEAELQRQKGRRDGFEQGMEAGRQSFGTPWPGTSIIIPTYNKRVYLYQCIQSILEHTPEPFEIIVVDNRSQDGTGQMLAGLSGKLGFGKLRWRVLEQNMGLAGAVNRGMMMARGKRLLLLHNDTLVTAGWLDNMTACLERVPDAGIVGPVTNLVSGPQQVRAPYRTIAAMRQWSAKRNLPNPGSWRETDRLMGFCMLMRRELMEEIGYFDEEFASGHYGDGDYGDGDYGLRARLQGQRLIIAGDAFIHQYGSSGTRSFGRRLEEFVLGSRRYFYAKWEHAENLAYDEFSRQEESNAGSELQLYPGGVAAEGADGTIWWLENGRRWRIVGSWPLPAVRLAMPLLRRLPISPEPVQAEHAALRWHGDAAAQPLPDTPEAITVQTDETAAEAKSTEHLSCSKPPELVLLPDGAPAYVERGRLRRFLNRRAIEGWALDGKAPARSLTEEDEIGLPAGLPIIPPPKLQQRL